MASKPHLFNGPVLGLLFSATLWGVFWYPLRLLDMHGLNGLWTSVIAYGAALLAGALYMYVSRHELAWREDKLRLVLMMLSAGWANVAFVMAVIDGMVMRVLVLFYLSPVWTVLLGRLLLGERATRLALAVVGVALTGVMVMLWDEKLGMPWPQVAADWLALSSGFAFALSNVLIRHMRRVSMIVKMLAVWLGVVLVAGTWIVLGGQAVPAVSSSIMMAAVALGLFGIMTVTLAVQYGLTHMPAHRSAVILLFELVAGAVSSQLLANEVISLREWIGGLMIVVSAYIAARPTADS